MTDLNAELDILERALAKAVDSRLAKNIDGVYDDLDNTTKDQEIRMAHVQEELEELREAFAELFAAHEDHEERADGMAEDLWDTMQQKRRKATPRVDPASALGQALDDDADSPGANRVRGILKSRGSTGAQTLANAMLPGQAQVVVTAAAKQLAEWFGKSGGQAVPYDGNVASHLLLTGQATQAQMQRWKKWHRLPDGLPLTVAKSAPKAVADDYRWTPGLPARVAGLHRVDTPKVDGAAIRARWLAQLSKGQAIPFADFTPNEVATLVMAKVLTQPEATAWKRSGVLRLDAAQGADVEVQRPLTAPVAATLLSDAELGKSRAFKPGYGHRSPQRQAAQRAAALVRLAQMAR